jgi:DNA-binding PadR family transcriptional regulator
MARTTENAPPREHLALEIRRGALTLAALSQLRDEQYGYSLRKKMAAFGLEVDEGTLYPLLRRLEAQGLLDSRWQLEEGRPRRYYRLNAQGEATLESLTADWKALAATMDGMLSGPR